MCIEGLSFIGGSTVLAVGDTRGGGGAGEGNIIVCVGMLNLQ